MLFFRIAVAAVLLFAQAAPGRVALTVNDASGGRIANAEVVLSRGGQERGATTNAEGTISVADLEPGQWMLTVRHEGFVLWQKPVTISEGILDVGVTLEVGPLVETVLVETTAGPANPIQLETLASAGTRLDLPVLELPASLVVLPQELIQDRGARSVVEAVQLSPGMVSTTGSGSIPSYSTRGWSGNDVSIMRDGIRQNTSSQSSRPVDAFILDRIEVLKGPASLMYGEGAIGGALNLVSKDPKERAGGDTLLSYGSFGSYRSGVGINVPLSRNLSARIDSSYSSTQGYADSPQRLRVLAGAVRWAPMESVFLKGYGTYTDDNSSAYYATPFINGKIDPRTRFINYNMKDRLTKTHNSWGQIVGDIALPGGWNLHNQAFASTLRWDWRNFESYVYNPATQKVDVSSYCLLWQDDVLVGNRLDAHKKLTVLGRQMNFTAGTELQRNDMHRANSCSNGTTIKFSVDPFNPEPIYDPGINYIRKNDVLVNTRAVYGEGVFDLTRRLKLVGGLRWEEIGVDYMPYPSKIVASSNYHPTTGRAGVVFDLNSSSTVYASYTRAVQPTTQLVDLDGSRQRFSLVPGSQFEVGTKGSAFNRRLEGTFAFFAIEKRNLLITTIVDNVSTNQQVGRRTSNGVELSVVGRPTNHFSMAADFAITGANFADFTEIVNGVNISRNGNTPTNIPHVVWNLTPSQRIGPMDISATVRQVGSRWGDTANTRLVGSYTTLDVQVGYRFVRGSRVRVRGRNLTDKIYTPSISLTSGRLEAPRSFDVTVTKAF